MSFRFTQKRAAAPKPQPASPQHLSAQPVSAADLPSALDRQKIAAQNANTRREAAPAPDPAPAAPVNAQPQREEMPAEPAPEKQPWWDRLFPGTDWQMVRIRFVFGFFALIFAALWGRAWYLHMVDGPRLAELARRQHVTVELVGGKRGNILDRDGQVLARSVEALSVYANPGEIRDALNAANTLGPILGISPQTIYDKISRPGRKFVWLRRKIDDYTASAVRKARLPGIGLTKEYERVYPFKHMAGQLLGFVGNEDKGLEGLERALDDRLNCAPTRQIVQRDATGRRFYLRSEGEEDPHGEDIQLTIDAQVQFFAEDAISRVVREEKAAWGGALVVDVPTGEILAWAQYPFFNPNTFRSSTAAVYRNRLAQDALEPGSTFKPLVLASAMQQRLVSRDTIIDCENGRWEAKFTTLRDTSRQGKIPVHKVLRYSSNIGMAKIGLMMGSKTMYDYLTELGFGEVTSVPVAQSRGILRKPKNWTEVDTMSISFGQGVSVTGLQMAQAYLTLLNNGVRKNLVLVRDQAAPAEPKQIFSRSVVREIRRMMVEVVGEKDGTGRRAAIDGVAVAGKTGTAQKADRRSGAYGAKRLASFVGFLPADAPRYLIVVFIDEPQNSKYGGVIAAPAFREIAQRSLAYAGDLDSQHLAALKKEGAAKRGDARERGFKIAGLTSPFSQPVRARQAQDVAVVRKPASHADAMRLPGHLARASATVPDVQGKTLRNAVELFARAGIMPELKGEGTRVVRQTPPPGTPWPDTKDGADGEAKKVECILWLSER
ncbi:MAG: penicillin-binding protein [Desulfovibrionaceae bacterium]|nr:penicillin-binding protein [Desulfovibrionaceae bacterium]